MLPTLKSRWITFFTDHGTFTSATVYGTFLLSTTFTLRCPTEPQEDGTFRLYTLWTTLGPTSTETSTGMARWFTAPLLCECARLRTKFLYVVHLFSGTKRTGDLHSFVAQLPAPFSAPSVWMWSWIRRSATPFQRQQHFWLTVAHGYSERLIRIKLYGAKPLFDFVSCDNWWWEMDYSNSHCLCVQPRLSKQTLLCWSTHQLHPPDTTNFHRVFGRSRPHSSFYYTQDDCSTCPTGQRMCRWMWS